jgi:predicted LPLAT superfamily acyltransferase
MEKKWAGTTYGNEWMHKWLIRLLRYIDNRILYAFVAIFVIPVCLLINPSRKITYRYFRKRHGYNKIKAAWKTYVNHYLFGQVVIDKFAMYAGKNFETEIEGYEHFLKLASKDEGFIQLSSHVGNYEIAGYTLKADKKKFNALVFFGEKASVMQNRMKLFADTNIKMISIRPDMGHLFEIDEALTNGETVSMPADRIFGSQKKLTINFLGALADFPYGPFSVATMRGLDVVTVHVIKLSWNKYKIIVKPLIYNKTASRKDQIKELNLAYVNELERIVSQYPTQWYNYFDFWTSN